MPSRIALEVLGALVAGLAALAIGEVDSSPISKALAICVAFAIAAMAWLAIRQHDPSLRLLVASAGAGLTLGTGAVHVLTYGSLQLPALLLWLLVTAELYRKAGERADPTAPGTRRGSAAGVIGLVAANRAEVLAAGASLGFVAAGMWLVVAILHAHWSGAW